MKQSEKDVGWMYHIFPVKKKSEPKPYPPLSKIAGLGIFNEECFDEEIKIPNSYKSTDTPYQTLSKMGGYQHLLYHKENDVIKRPPVPYPRCDWFYLEDMVNDIPKTFDCGEPKKYEFKVPEYMAHDIRKKMEYECVDEIPPIFEKIKKKRKHKKLPDKRPGYSEYTRKPVKLTFAQRIYPSDPRVSFPKRDISKELERSKEVIENYYVRDYDQYRRQWNEIKNTENLRDRVVHKMKFGELTKDMKARMAMYNNRKLNGIFPYA